MPATTSSAPQPKTFVNGEEGVLDTKSQNLFVGMFRLPSVRNTALWKPLFEHKHGKLADIVLRFLAISITKELMHDADAR
jgi:hypothetical protein